MGAFEHIVSLLSFVYALAIAHLLLSVATLIRESARVRFSLIQAWWMANALVVIVANWIGFWDLRGLPSWSVGTICFTFATAFTNYLQAALACPEIPAAGPIDMVEFQSGQRRRYVGAFVASGVLALLANAVFGSVFNVMTLILQNLAVIPMLVVAVAVMIWPARWVQIGAPILLTVVWGFYFIDLQAALK